MSTPVTTSTTLVTSGTPWHPQSFADLARRLQTDPEAVSHDVDFTFQALAMRSQTQQTDITQITNIINGKGTVSSVALAMPSVFGVAGSPITTAGTFTVSLVSQAQNLVWASPDGSAGPPTFRALVAGDIPSLPYLPSSTVLAQTITKVAHEWLDSYSATTGLFTQSQPAIADLSDAASVVQTSRTISTTAPLTGGGDLSADRTLAISDFVGDTGTGGVKGAVPAPAAGDAAAGKFLKADGTWTAPPGGGSGTVTSVALTAPAEFSVAGSPVTTTGTLAITKATQSANTVWAGPTTGAAAAPTFRAIDPADLPLASSSAFGAVKVDGTTITATAGVISAVAGTTPGLALITTVTASSSTELDFTSVLTSLYDDYLVVIDDLIPNTSAVDTRLQWSTTNGSSYDTANTNYSWSGNYALASGTTGGAIGYTNSLPGLRVGVEQFNTASGNSISSRFEIHNPLGTAVWKKIIGQYSSRDVRDSVSILMNFQGTYLSTSAQNAFRIVPSSGNFTSGIVRLYGMKK